MSRRPSRRGTAAAGIAVLVCLAPALSGCGDDNGGESAPTGFSTPDLASVPWVDASVRLPLSGMVKAVAGPR